MDRHGAKDGLHPGHTPSGRHEDTGQKEAYHPHLAGHDRSHRALQQHLAQGQTALSTILHWLLIGRWHPQPNLNLLAQLQWPPAGAPRALWQNLLPHHLPTQEKARLTLATLRQYKVTSGLPLVFPFAELTSLAQVVKSLICRGQKAGGHVVPCHLQPRYRHVAHCGKILATPCV